MTFLVLEECGSMSKMSLDFFFFDSRSLCFEVTIGVWEPSIKIGTVSKFEGIQNKKRKKKTLQIYWSNSRNIIEAN